MLNWTDKQNGVDDVLAEDINDIAHAVIDLQENDENNTVDQTYNPESENAQSGKAVTQAIKDNAVLYTSQSLTEEEKAQARENIGASKSDTSKQIVRVTRAVSSFELENAYINKSGSLVTHTNYIATEPIPAIPETTIIYNDLQAINGHSCVIAFYDVAHNFISGIWQEADENHPSGTGTRLTGECVVPTNATHFRACTYNDKTSKSRDIEYSSIAEVAENGSNNGKQWLDKNWVAFGTSITDTSYINAENGEVTGKYVPYLTELSGLNVANHGIAGGTIAQGGVHGGSSNILTRILSTDISSANLITIEGFVNDFACAIDLGNLGDTENTTLCGAIYQAVKYCLENSNATVVLITDSTGREYTLTSTGQSADYTVTRKNSIDKTQNDYNETIVNMAKFLGVHVIDAGRKSQINEFNPDYFADHLHHSELGGKQYAETIWDELKGIHCNTDVSI